MRLHKILLEFKETTAYHLTTSEAVSLIKMNGLRSGNVPRFGHPGDGIYVFFEDGLKHTSGMADYLGLDNWALVKTRVAPNSLLMDEDALDYEFAHEDLEKAYPELVEEFMNLVESHVKTSSVSLRNDCIKFIEKHNIQPTPHLKTHFGHYSLLTARTTQRVLPVDGIDFNPL